MLKLFARLLLLIVLFAECVSLNAQKQKRDPLTPAQQEQIAEAGIDPDGRIGLYIKYANEHALTLQSLTKRTEAGRGRRIDNELQDFTALVDELADNLDEYGARKADLRKALKSLREDLPRWQEIVRNLPKDPVAQISLSEATEALNDLVSDSKQLSEEQEAYFKEHKDAKGQEREEPK